MHLLAQICLNYPSLFADEYMDITAEPTNRISFDKYLGSTVKHNGRTNKYLGSTVQESGSCERELKKRVQAGWNGWRKVSGVICGRRLPARVKGKVYSSVVRPEMVYGLEMLAVTKKQMEEMEVAEMKMLRFAMEVTRKDKIRNEYIRDTVKAERLGMKMREGSPR